ncbi:MAG: septum site-determining protein MinC [Cyanobium sp.]
MLPQPRSEEPADLASLAEQAIASSALLSGSPLQGPVHLEAGAWRLGLSALRGLAETLASWQLELVDLTSSNPRTHVAAAGLGIESRWPMPVENANPTSRVGAASGNGSPAAMRVHQGTLRSGDHLEAEGTLLLLGDVNPGARVSAAGHVLVWGRLRGTAHAGCNGDTGARIVALQLRPLQLRIADAVARGPEGSPPAGLAEAARIVAGAIQIDPAEPVWPLIG